MFFISRLLGLGSRKRKTESTVYDIIQLFFYSYQWGEGDELNKNVFLINNILTSTWRKTYNSINTYNLQNVESLNFHKSHCIWAIFSVILFCQNMSKLIINKCTGNFKLKYISECFREEKWEIEVTLKIIYYYALPRYMNKLIYLK